jgi:transposase
VKVPAETLGWRLTLGSEGLSRLQNSHKPAPSGFAEGWVIYPPYPMGVPTGLRGVWAPEGATIDWDKIMPRGFHVLQRRWIVERTNAWITRHRRLSRDFEGTHSTSRGLHLSGDDQDHAISAGSCPSLNGAILHTLL